MFIKIVLWALLVCVIFIGVVYWYGTSLPSEKSYARKIIINASIETVYDLAIDAKSQNSWRQDVAKITINPDRKSWVEHTKQGDISFEIVQEDRPNSFSLAFKGNGFEGTWRGEFTSIDGQAEVKLVENISIENSFFKVLSKVMKFTEKFMDRYIYDLKTEAEKRRNN
jgi:hypothetical protein